MATIKFTPEELHNTAVTYEQKLLLMVYKSASDYLAPFTGIPNVKGSHILGKMDLDIEIGPYDASYKNPNQLTIEQRILEVFKGSAIQDVDFNELALEFYGSMAMMGQELQNSEICKNTMFVIAARLGKALGLAAFNADRNPGGHKTKDLFNGWDTIANDEILAGKITEELGNRYDFKETITAVNAVDQLIAFYDSTDQHLKDIETELLIPTDMYTNYCRDYQTSRTGLIYNDKFEKVTLEGSNGKCTLRPLQAKAGTKVIQLAPKKVLVYGYGEAMDDEKIKVGEYAPLLTTFTAVCRFGCQYRTIDKEWIKFGKLFQG